MKFKNLLANLNILIRPWLWPHLYPISKEWNKQFNELLDKYDFFFRGQHVARLGEEVIWVYHEYFRQYHGEFEDFMPDRKTVYRAKKMLRATFTEEMI
jgi:hypothetical protein